MQISSQTKGMDILAKELDHYENILSVVNDKNSKSVLNISGFINGAWKNQQSRV